MRYGPGPGPRKKRQPLASETPASDVHARRHPWALGAIRQSPMGLRERVLRVAFSFVDDLHDLRRSRDAALIQVIDWRREQPAQFKELCGLLQVPFDEAA